MLKAGFSRADITPPLNSDIQGYFFRRYASGVLDPLYLNAVAFSDGKETAVIISVDALMITMEYCNEIRKHIAKKVDIKEGNVMICCLHQHTSFALRGKKETNNVLENRSYLDFLWDRFADVVKMAMDDMSDTIVFIGEGETSESIAFIRRYVMKSGEIETNPMGRYLEVDRPYRNADNSVRLCRFKRCGRCDIALINFSTHADVIHGDKLSADWPGFARGFVEKDLDALCMLTVGAEGDSNHADFTIPQYKDGYEHSRHMGRVIADAVVRLWDKAEMTDCTSVTVGSTVIFNETRTDGIDTYDEAMRFIEESKKNNLTGGEHITKLGNASRITKLRHEPIFQKVPLTVINLGKIGFVGFGGEPFTEYTDKIKDGASDRFVIVSCCTNGGEGYLPTKEAFSEGGYEAGSSPFSPNLEEQCVNEALMLLKK